MKGARRSYRITDFYELTASEGGAFTPAQEPAADPRVESLQRQLTELDNCLRGEPHLLATPQEALSVQEKIEAMLVGQG